MNILKGPADADHYRVRVGRYGDRWYTDPLATDGIAAASDWQGPSWSIVKGAAGKDWSFVANKRNATAPQAELERIAKLPVEQRSQAFNDLNKNGLTQAAGRGTIIHLWAEDLLAGRTPRNITNIDLMALRLPQAALDKALAYKAAIAAFFDAYQPEVVAAEFVALHRTLNGIGYGCTPDVIVRIDGQLLGVDWKSRGADSDHGAYPEEAAQIAAGARAEYMIVTGTDGNPSRALIPKVDTGIVVSIKPDGCRVYPVDIDKAFRHVEAMHSFWVARLDEKASVGKPWAPKVAAGGVSSPIPNVADDAAPPADEFTVTTSNGHQPPVQITYTRTQLRDRIVELIAAGHELELRRRWPAGVPPLSKPGHTAEQLVDILNAVKRCETETSATFHPDDTPDPQPPVEPEPELPPAAELDEGGLICDADRAVLERAFMGLNDVEKSWVAAITYDASMAGRSISVSAFPTVRRWSIARAVIVGSHLPAGVWDAAVDIATVDQTANSDQTLGALLGTFTIEQANRLHDALDHTAAA